MRPLYALAAAATAVALTPGIVFAQSRTIYVQVNGNSVQFIGTQPIERYGRVLVPLRDIIMPLGAALTWDPRTQVVTAAHGDTTVRLKIGSQIARVNGRKTWLDVPPRTMNGYTLVPLRFFSDAFGADVAWDPITQTVAIDTLNGQGSVRTANAGSVRRFSRTEANRMNAATGDQSGPANVNRPNGPAAPRYSAEYGRYASDQDYLQFLRDQDFRRYLNNRSTWMTEYQEFRRAHANDGSAPADYEAYLTARDYDLFNNNREMWRLSYQAFLRQRRVMNPLAGNTNWNAYYQDRDSLVRDTDRLLSVTPLPRNNGTTGGETDIRGSSGDRGR